MKLVLQPSNGDDFVTAKTYHGPEKGDLSAAAIQATWHLDPNDPTAAMRRAEWSCQQQKDLVENDPTVRLVKVIDEETKEIVASGRWHRYPKGYQHVRDLEVVGLKDRNAPETWPEGLNKGLYIGFLDEGFAQRRDWMGIDHYWVLTNIVTREPYRRHGAGSLILNWGLEQAREEGVPAYLEAVVEAKGLYEKHGFREVGSQDVDCEPYGLPGVIFTLARMRADPK